MRMWNCRVHSDGLLHGACGVNGSSRSSNSRGSLSQLGSEWMANHHHSVSDDVLSDSGSPPDDVHEPLWASPLQIFNVGDHVASSAGGSVTQTSWHPRSSQWRCALKGSAASPGFVSPSSLSETSHQDSSSKRPLSSGRSHMSKAVYPLVFHNPVSECEAISDNEINSVDKLTTAEDRPSYCHWPKNTYSTKPKFHRTLTEIGKPEMSPDPGASSRRDGFRWSSASSCDLGLDGERFDIAEHMDVEILRKPASPVTHQKCGVCGKLLWQKSPWSSHRIMRGSDMPTAGILPCSHVFHADCLEQVTPKTEIHDPPCPLCLKTVGVIEEFPSVTEPLQMVLRSVRRSRGMLASEAWVACNSSGVSDDTKDRLRESQLAGVPQLRSCLKRRFTLKGKVGQGIFKSKVFCRIGSSSNRDPVRNQISIQ